MPARCFIGCSLTEWFVSSRFGVLDISFSSLFVRGVGETWQRSILHCGWLVMEYLEHGYSHAFSPFTWQWQPLFPGIFGCIAVLITGIAPRAKGSGRGVFGWAGCRGTSVNHLFWFPSFLPLVRAGEDILCFLAACLWSSSCLVTAGCVGYFVCNSWLAYSWRCSYYYPLPTCPAL